MKIEKKLLETNHIKTTALVYEGSKPLCCLFTHGYSSSKQDHVAWMMKCLELDVSCVIFDLPNHLLGNSNSVNLENFEQECHLLFLEARKFFNHQNFIYGGFSLGSLLALKAASILPPLKVLVAGLGYDPNYEKHLYEYPPFAFLLKFRSALIENLDTKKVFQWVQEEKKKLQIKNQDLVLISGEDDQVVGKQGMEELIKLLGPDNFYQVIKPQHLPHHLPHQVASYLPDLLKSVLNSL